MPTSAQLRSDVAALATLAERDLAPLWAAVEDALRAETALRDVLPALIDTYGAGAATIAADWYDDLRDSRGIRGRFTAEPADVPETGSQALVGWALAEANDYPSFQTLILGGTQRRIANFAMFVSNSAGAPRLTASVSCVIATAKRLPPGHFGSADSTDPGRSRATRSSTNAA